MKVGFTIAAVTTLGLLVAPVGAQELTGTMKKIKETGSTSVRVELDDSNPLKATAFFRGRIDGTHARTGVRVFYFDQVEIDWQQAGNRWLVIDYRAKFRGKPITASDGLREAR